MVRMPPRYCAVLVRGSVELDTWTSFPAYIASMSSALALAAVPTVLLVGLVALTLVPVNLQLTVTDTALVLEPQGLDVLWTLHRRIEIPLSQVSSIKVVPRDQAPELGARVGASLPGIITAGSFGAGDDRTFWDVRRGDPLLVIYCQHGARYRAVVLEFADPYATLARTQTVLTH
jgi:hypothetical protein